MNNQGKQRSHPKLLLFISEDWYFWSHRRSIAIEAIRRGYDVTLVTRVNNLESQIDGLGVKLIRTNMVRSSINPFKELFTLIDLIRIYKEERPDIVHHVALKPVIYGTIAAKLLRIDNIVNALGGLGHVFSSNNWKVRLFRSLYIPLLRILFNGKSTRLILQNPDDIEIILNNKIITRDRVELIRGSGAKLDYFKPVDEPENKQVVMYAGRFLWSKGVGDIVEAAKILRDQGEEYEFIFVGNVDTENPESISVNQLNKWVSEGLIQWWEYQTDMAEIISKSTLISLPAIFREGLPKILIEAAASGRPIIASDQPGIREIVKHNWNGLLIPPHNPQELAQAIKKLLADKKLRQEMGRNGRKLVEEEFSEEIVLKQTFSLYKELIG